MRRLILKSFKYAAIFAFIMSLFHIMLLLLDIKLDIAEKVVFLSPMAAIYGMALSYVLKYCVLHRLCLMYTWIVSILTKNAQFNSVFVDTLNYARVIILIIGCVIVGFLLTHKIQCKYVKD